MAILRNPNGPQEQTPESIKGPSVESTSFKFTALLLHYKSHRQSSCFAHSIPSMSPQPHTPSKDEWPTTCTELWVCEVRSQPKIDTHAYFVRRLKDDEYVAGLKLVAKTEEEASNIDAIKKSLEGFKFDFEAGFDGSFATLIPDNLKKYIKEVKIEVDNVRTPRN